MGNRAYELYVVRGPKPGQIHPLTGATVSVGRDPHSDFLINDPEVSRQQALLIRTASGEYQIQDLGSTNGTYVDGERLGNAPVVLRPLQAITIGGAVTFILRERTSAARQRAVQAGTERPDEMHEAPDKATSELGADEAVGRARSAPVSKELDLRANAEERASSFRGGKPAGSPQRERSQMDPALRTIVQPAAPEDAVLAVSGADQPDTGFAKGLSPNLILGLVLVLVCGCLTILFFLLYLGGDLFLRQAGLVP